MLNQTIPSENNAIILSSEAKTLELGFYKHYKGNKYQVLGIAIHSETLEELVIYKALYGGRLTWVRPLKMFFETVIINGETKPRFNYLGKSKL
jgi:cyclomaltodextrinase / maltogenic alpha-amylase / neopullulanase